MKKELLLEKICAKSKVNGSVAKRVVKSLIHAIGESIQNGEKVTLTGLGTFKIKNCKPKVARNMQTGETVQLPAGKKISFKPSLSFKQLLKNNSPHSNSGHNEPAIR